jgi:flavin reductase (DIM6/NTAB) family NADH-FMN oxidoreductase RutF
VRRAHEYRQALRYGAIVRAAHATPKTMEIDLNNLPRAHRYKMLTSLVVPRPIALVSTLGENGVVNAAPFSFFNALGDDPPILVFSADARTSGPLKDTVHNVLTTKEFVVNLVDEAIAEKMHGCAVDTPPEMSEFDLVGFTTAPSQRVKPPRIAESPVSFECKLHTALDFKTRHVCIGEILWMHVRDGILDPSNHRRKPNTYFPIGRLYATRYCRTRDEFALDNSQYAAAANANSAVREF